MSDTSTARRVLQRVVFPTSRDIDVLPLYVDPDRPQLDVNTLGLTLKQRSRIPPAEPNAEKEPDPHAVLGRRRYRIRESDRVSFGTYFNAFAASYWRRWTVVDEVTLHLRVSGRGSTVIVYRSMPDGRAQRVEDTTVDGDEVTDVRFDLSLATFADGGWYWFDIIAGPTEAVLEEASWAADVPPDRTDPGSVTIGITTMNRPDFCAALLTQIGSDPDVAAVLDEVVVAEQGTRKVSDDPGFAEARAALGDRLRVIEQGNMGGSGGYARAQLETLEAGRSTYMMCMDDDVVCEPESIIRAVTFGDLCRRPTIVGGHMFSLYAKSRLHSFGEIVNRYRFWWMSPPTVNPDWDFGERNLRSARWLHRRVDVDFNGWFMCLIPTEVLRTVGLSLPLFIKWDDSEFGVRAGAAGFPTVSLPGTAVWHIPWTDKNDALDWQSYFHQRNRTIAALLHSPYERGGRLVRESFNHQVKHLFSMQYSTAELRHLALEDVLAGPARLHPDLTTKLPALQAKRKEYVDARTSADPDAFPPTRREKPPKRGQDPTLPKSSVGQLLSAVTSAVRQVRPKRALADEFPEARLAALDAKWWMISQFDSVVVSMPDGGSASWHHRDPDEFRDLLARTLEIHQRLYREWPRLAREYRQALPDITSPEQWAKTFQADAVSAAGGTAVTTQSERPGLAPEDEVAPAQERPPLVAPDAPLVAPFAKGGLADVFRRRYLLKLLVQKEIRARYQGSLLGLMWSYVQPLVRFCMYFFVIGLVLGLHKSVPNFAIHMFAALVAVHFFTETFSTGTRSIMRNKAMVQKMALPREMFPVASTIVSAVNSFPQVLILLAGAIGVGWRPDLMGIYALLLGLAIITVLGTALALLFAAMNVFFRDFQNIVSTFQLFTHWIVPMIYPFSKIARGAAGSWLYYLYLANPLTVGVLLMQRAFWVPTLPDCVRGGGPKQICLPHGDVNAVGWPDLPNHLFLLGWIMLAASFVVLALCQVAFNRLEGKFAERL